MSSSSAPAHLESATTPTVRPMLTPAVVMEQSALPLRGKRPQDPFMGQCPNWCPGDHPFECAGDDRVHYGDASCLPLELEQVSVEYSGDDSPDAYWPAVTRVDLRQHYREVEPRISIGLNDDRGMEFTLAEAAVLMEMLQSKLEQAKGASA